MVAIILIEGAVIMVDIILSQYLDITLMFFANIVLGVFMMLVLHRIQSKIDEDEAERTPLTPFKRVSVEKINERV